MIREALRTPSTPCRDSWQRPTGAAARTAVAPCARSMKHGKCHEHEQCNEHVRGHEHDSNAETPKCQNVKMRQSLEMKIVVFLFLFIIGGRRVRQNANMSKCEAVEIPKYQHVKMPECQNARQCCQNRLRYVRRNPDQSACQSSYHRCSSI